MTISTSIQNDLAVISVKGRFKYDLTRPFRDATEQIASQPSVRRIEVDLADATYMDSSALGLLLALRDAVRARGMSIQLTNVRGNVRQVLDLARFDRLFAISGE